MKRIREFFDKSGSVIAKRILEVVSVIAAVLAIAIIISGFEFSKIGVTFYSLSSNDINDQLRVVLLSDLHLREFGKDNSVILDRVKTLEPDIITVPGDLTIYGNPEHDVAVKFLNNLSDIAPTYYSYGNHEYAEILFDKNSKLRGDLADTKATLLNKNTEVIDVNGAKIALGGFCVGANDFDDMHKDYLEEFCNTDGYKILLCHHVECFESVMEGYPVDLAITGHAHGGQVILPVIGPLYSPDQGFFPELTNGLVERCGSNVVISRGLGNSNNLPRYNNDPEIVVVDVSCY